MSFTIRDRYWLASIANSVLIVSAYCARNRRKFPTFSDLRTGPQVERKAAVMAGTRGPIMRGRIGKPNFFN
jgi:hypothetical protein